MNEDGFVSQTFFSSGDIKFEDGRNLRLRIGVWGKSHVATEDGVVADYIERLAPLGAPMLLMYDNESHLRIMTSVMSWNATTRVAAYSIFGPHDQMVAALSGGDNGSVNLGEPTHGGSVQLCSAFEIPEAQFRLGPTLHLYGGAQEASIDLSLRGFSGHGPTLEMDGGGQAMSSLSLSLKDRTGAGPNLRLIDGKGNERGVGF